MKCFRLWIWRMEYLNKIGRYPQEKRCIIYLDEMWFGIHDTASKVLGG